MTRSATDVMQDIIAAAVLDAVAALKAASKGLPNTLLRDLNAIHANTTVADLPSELQAAIGASVRAAFSKLLKEGYSVAPGTGQPPRPPRPAGAFAPGERRPHSRPGSGPGGGDRRPHNRGGPPREGGGGAGRGRPGGGGDRPKGPRGPR